MQCNLLEEVVVGVLFCCAIFNTDKIVCRGSTGLGGFGFSGVLEASIFSTVCDSAGFSLVWESSNSFFSSTLEGFFWEFISSSVLAEAVLLDVATDAVVAETETGLGVVVEVDTTVLVEARETVLGALVLVVVVAVEVFELSEVVFSGSWAAARLANLGSTMRGFSWKTRCY